MKRETLKKDIILLDARAFDEALAETPVAELWAPLTLSLRTPTHKEAHDLLHTATMVAL